MAFLDDLAAGGLGVSLQVPEHFEIDSDEETSAKLLDPRGIQWMLFFFPDLHLDLGGEHADLLDRDLRRHARALFDTMYEEQPPGDDPPRTQDPAWTPVVESERLALGGGQALSVIHRMKYQPGAEIIMGHTLIPVQRGLFEARWITASPSTGMRESILMMNRLEGERKGEDRGEADEVSFPPQAWLDDPAHDAQFPEHPLTLSRAAKQWPEEMKLRVAAPAAAPPRGALTLEPLACSIAAPPRFISGKTLHMEGNALCLLHRVSFCGTDGIDQLIVGHTEERFRGLAVSWRLARYARRVAPKMFEELGYMGVQASARALETVPPSVEVVAEGALGAVGAGRGHMVSRWFLDGGGQVWVVLLHAAAVIPLEELSAEVAAVVASWKPLAGS